VAFIDFFVRRRKYWELFIVKIHPRYLQDVRISINLKKYKMCRFGITHNKKVANRLFFRYCHVHILRLLIS